VAAKCSFAAAVAGGLAPMRLKAWGFVAARVFARGSQDHYIEKRR
jgi:hypothetical protein